MAIAACLQGCQAFSLQSTKPTPPVVSDCLEQPQGVYPPEPARPAAGAPITDVYVQALHAWGNAILGLATVDRTLWRGEHRCIRKMVDVGQIR